MTWLSRIEEANRSIRSKRVRYYAENESERMARVIRELVEIVYCVSTEGIVLDMVDALSPDAKELLDG